MTERQKERLEFLEETVKFYSEDTSRRSITADGCLYKNPENDNKCAIGRHIPKELYSKSFENKTFASLPSKIRRLPIFKNLGEDFLAEIQYLHDADPCWDKKGISKTGKNFVNIIKEKYIK